jgi:hypothetical protein
MNQRSLRLSRRLSSTNRVVVPRISVELSLPKMAAMQKQNK